MPYLIEHFPQVAGLALQHLQITLLALGIAGVGAIPLALALDRWRGLQLPILGSLSMLYTIPSLALMILLLPLLGLNSNTVIVAIAVYAQVILVRGLTVGLASIPASVLEAAQGMGMNPWQRWWWIQVPLVLPIFLAGLRLAATVGMAIATLGAKFGAGGLGVLLFDGIAQAGRSDKIWAGAIAVATLTLILNGLLLRLEHQTTYPKQSRRG